MIHSTIVKIFNKTILFILGYFKHYPYNWVWRLTLKLDRQAWSHGDNPGPRGVAGVPGAIGFGPCNAGPQGPRGTIGCAGYIHRPCQCKDGGKIHDINNRQISVYLQEFDEIRFICRRCNCWTKYVDRQQDTK